jgi:S1-C subfamily serine protease
VMDSSAMLNLVAELAPGSPATLKVVRDQKQLELRAVIGRRPKQQARRTE